MKSWKIQCIPVENYEIKIAEADLIRLCALPFLVLL